MADFFHIYVSPNSGVTREQIEEKLNKALDWYRYTTNIYLVYTSSDINMWQKRLVQYVEPDGALFIAKLDLSVHQGWMSKDFWEWISKHQTGIKSTSPSN